MEGLAPEGALAARRRRRGEDEGEGMGGAVGSSAAIAEPWGRAMWRATAQGGPVRERGLAGYRAIGASARSTGALSNWRSCHPVTHCHQGDMVTG